MRSAVRDDKHALLMIAASLVVIAIVLSLVTSREVGLRRDQIQSQGTGLASALSRIPLDRLVSASGHVGALSRIRTSDGSGSLAYAEVVDTAGRSLERVSQPHAPAPLSTAPTANPANWTGERLLELGESKTRVREFYAPILEAGELTAQVRIGYFEPRFRMVLADTSFHARLAFVVFLLTPLGYFWLRRAQVPLEEIERELDATEATWEQSGIADGADVADGSIVGRFRQLSHGIERKSADMEKQRMALLASTKVLAHHKNRIEVVFEAVPDALLAIDETGTVTAVNARTESVLRAARDELMGLPVAGWSPCSEVTQMVRRFTGARGTRLRSDSVDYTQDGASPRQFRASIYPLADSSGALVVLRDTTKEHAEKKTQAEFLAHMAHELKAPLNVMSMYAETLLGPDANDEAFRVDACNVLQDEISRLNGLINDIFSIGRIESGVVAADRQRIKTGPLLEDIFESTMRDAQKRELECVLDLADDLPAIFADKQLISVAVKNLLTNAIKYNREGGKLTLQAGVDSEGLTIRVADTGVGIDEEELDRVFEKFFRSEHDDVRKIAGHGLGLAIVQEIVTLHGGELRVQSQLGVGSEFFIVFGQNSAVLREEA